ncbi:MAG: hypothetical protein LWX83_03545 [Anaerolineae bacterium]|nr:hypothetical protein [Anaerolineae bacterium]
MNFYPRTRLDQPAQYRITIQGRLPESWSDYFGELTAEEINTVDNQVITLLSGEVSDQSSLHGVLRHIRDLGLPLLEVKILSESNLSQGNPKMFKSMSSSSIFTLACKGVALAMSVAAIVLNILKSAGSDTIVSLLTIGLAALALASLKQD